MIRSRRADEAKRQKPKVEIEIDRALESDSELVKKPGSNAWVLTGFYRDSGDRSTGYLDETSTSPSSTSPRHVRGGAESLSPRIENERHALASDKSDGLGEHLSMESNSSISQVKRSDDGSIQDVYDTRTLKEQKTPFSRGRTHGSGRYFSTSLATKS